MVGENLATSRRPRSPSRRRSRAISCVRRSTTRTRRAPSAGCSTWHRAVLGDRLDQHGGGPAAGSRVCPDCGRANRCRGRALELQVPEESSPNHHHEGTGCKNCNNTATAAGWRSTSDGAHGRAQGVRLQGYSTAELKHEAIRLGMQTLRQAGVAKIIEGMTTPRRSCASPPRTDAPEETMASCISC